MRVSKKIALNNTQEFKSRLLAWSQQFDMVFWLDSNMYPQNYSSFEAVLAVDAHTEIQCDHYNAFSKLQQYKNQLNDFIFGYLSYDLKNGIEDLSSANFDGLTFPELYFFQPKKLFFLNDGELEVQYLKEFEKEIENDLEQIFSHDVMLKQPFDSALDGKKTHDVKIHKRITKKEYLKHLNTILNHIRRGDIYEVNFCQEFYAKDAVQSTIRYRSIDTSTKYQYHLSLLS